MSNYKTFKEFTLNEFKVPDEEILKLVKRLNTLEKGKRDAAAKSEMTDIELSLKKEKVMTKSGNWNLKHPLFGDIDDIIG